jgi:hypothetical protein
MPIREALIWTAVIVIPLFGLIYLIQRRAETNGPLFLGPATKTGRVLALLLGIGLAGAAVLAPIETRIELGFVAILLLAYAFGAGADLRRLQAAAARPSVSRPILVRLRNLLLGLAAIVIMSILFVALMGWILTNPVGQIILVILIMLGAILAIPLSLIILFRHLRNL